MTRFFPPPDPVDAADANPGGAAVASLRGLGQMQAMAVMMMRDGFSGPAGQQRVREVFLHTLGTEAGTAAADAWDDFAGFLLAQARRPLMRHALPCPCVGADEAVVAQILHLAATGAREDAMLTLTLLVPADRALCAEARAEAAGLAVMRAARIAARLPATGTPTFH